MNLKNKIKNFFQDKDIRRYVGTKIFYNSCAKFLKGKSFHLNQVFLFPILSCNLSCMMCGFFGKEGIMKQSTVNGRRSTVNLERWKTLIDEITKYKPKIYFTGGEPLLYPYLFELAQYIKSKKLKISLQTNGTLLTNKLKEILIFDEISISLDGPTEEINDRIRGNNSFEKTVYSLKELSIKRDKLYPKINICYTISDMNYRYLTDMVEFLQASDFKIDNLVFQHLMFTNYETILKYKEKVSAIPEYKNDMWDGIVYSLYNMDIKSLIQQISQINRTKNVSFNISFFPNFTQNEVYNFYKNPDSVPDRFSDTCLTPFLDTIIFPDGNMYLCQDYLVGNIKEDSFQKLWNNVYSKKIRVKILKEGIYTVCRSCCGKYVY